MYTDDLFKIWGAAEVIAKTYHIRKYLENHDPKALEQLDSALRLSPEDIAKVQPIGPQSYGHAGRDPDWSYEEED
jgi:hypothetical protein